MNQTKTKTEGNGIKYTVEEIARYIFDEGWPSFVKSMLKGCEESTLDLFIKDYCIYSPLTRNYYPDQMKIAEDFYGRNFQIWMDNRPISNFISMTKATKLKEQFERQYKKNYPELEFEIKQVK